MKIDISQAVADLKSKGYHQSVIIDPSHLPQLEVDLKKMKAELYNEENLSKHSVYLSDKTETRESHAMMICRAGTSPLPIVKHEEGIIDKLLEFHDMTIGQLTGTYYPGTARSMLNFQEYHAGSKPLARHYDGEYLKYNKVSPTEFKLEEGLLPRYVMVFTIRNENVGEENEGTVLFEVATGNVIKAQSRPGQVLIFDNIRFRHEVPMLSKPRFMCGLRSFDYEPGFFVSDLDLDERIAAHVGWKPMPDAGSPGHVTMVSTRNSVERQERYLLEEWPAHWEQIKKEGAVF